MSLEKINFYCVTNKEYSFFKDLPYNFAGVGKENFSKNFILSNNLDNIFYKEKYYSELTFHYWFWKNMLHNFSDDSWIGFCQKRRFWLKKVLNELSINQSNLKDNVLLNVPDQWILGSYDAAICEPIFLDSFSNTKLIKKGFRSLVKDPSIFFNKKKRTIKLHFDMHHGYGNLEKATDLLEIQDREEFRKFINASNKFHPNIMFISKPRIANEWFEKLFSWLFRCEKIFGFYNLSGYETQRLYAYLAERYLSFWFTKYTKFIEWPIITINNLD
jgi:hypothetical protein